MGRRAGERPALLRKSVVVPVLRSVASIVMLGVLLPRVHLSSLLPTWRPNAFFFLVGALVVTFIGVVLSAMRWQRVLSALDVHAPLPALVNHYLAGLFVGNFLPSTIGGDVLRVTRLASTTGDRANTFASVVLERLTGWLVLPVISLIGLLGNPTLLRLGTATRVALAIAIGTLVALCVMLAAAANRRIGSRLTGEGWLRFTGAVHLGLDRFRRRPAAAAEVLAAGFAYQLTVMFAAFLAAQAMGVEVGWTAIIAFMPAVAIAQVLPVTIGGLGLREFAIVIFLKPLGVGTSEAIALGLLIYGINLAVSLLGAPSFAVGNRTKVAGTAPAT